MRRRLFTVHGLVWGCLCFSGLGMAFIFKLRVSECLLCRLLAELTQPLCQCPAAPAPAWGSAVVMSVGTGTSWG